MSLNIERVCRELTNYPEPTRKSILHAIEKDPHIPQTIKNILTFLILNAPELLSPSSPLSRQGNAPAHIPATQEAHQ